MLEGEGVIQVLGFVHIRTLGEGIGTSWRRPFQKVKKR